MSIVSNDPSWWSFISWTVFYSYWMVAAGAVVVYDWVLTLGQEIELIWKQRWSLMTVLYLVIRYIGIPYSVVNVLPYMTSVSLTDAGCNIMNYARNVTNVVVTVMLGVIMIARLHAMYQRSRIMLVFLVTVFLAITITGAAITAIGLEHMVVEELILSGAHACGYGYVGFTQILGSVVWILSTVWEVLALCLSVWISVKHFRDLRQLGQSTGSTMGDCFRVLIKYHVLYFASFVSVSCLQLAYLSPELVNSNAIGAAVLNGALQILLSVQMLVLGPRLILSVREFNAELVDNSDAETSMNSIVFQANVHVQTSSTM